MVELKQQKRVSGGSRIGDRGSGRSWELSVVGVGGGGSEEKRYFR